MIHKLRFELKTPNREMAHVVQNRISELSRDVLPGELEKLCEGLATEQEHRVLPRLELELGTLTSEGLEEEMVRALHRELPDAFNRVPSPETVLEHISPSRGILQNTSGDKASPPQAPLTPFEFHAQWLSHYLRWGTAPWWAEAAEWPGLSKVLDVLEETDGKAKVAQVLREVLKEKTARKRFVKQLEPASHNRWLERLFGFPVPGADVLQTLHTSLKAFFKSGLPAAAPAEDWYECQWEQLSEMEKPSGGQPLWRALGERFSTWYPHLSRDLLRAAVSQTLSQTKVTSEQVEAFLEGMGWTGYATGRKDEMGFDSDAAGPNFAAGETAPLPEDSPAASSEKPEGLEGLTGTQPDDGEKGVSTERDASLKRRVPGEGQEKRNSFGDSEGRDENVDERVPSRKQSAATGGEFGKEGPKSDEDPGLEEALEKQAAQGWVVENAGLVLLWPYFKTLFESLKVVRGGRFISEEGRERGLHLLHYLVYGREEPEEHALLLDKIFCDWPLGSPVRRWLALTDAERKECDALLDAVMEHWKALGNSGREALRETFLIRRGILVSEDGLWRLRVEKGPYDMLVDKLPWGFSLIALSWMEKRLQVEWT